MSMIDFKEYLEILLSIQSTLSTHTDLFAYLERTFLYTKGHLTRTYAETVQFCQNVGVSTFEFLMPGQSSEITV